MHRRLAVLRQRALALGAALRQMRLEAREIVAVERAKRVAGRQLAEGLVGRAYGRPPMRPRNFSIPRRMRVLTVPSGCFRRADISVWVRPSKYANSMTSR